MDKSAKHILEITVRMIESQIGIETLTVRKIAKEANVSIGAINYHFNSKEELLRKAAEILLDQGVSENRKFLNDPSIKPAMQLKNFILGLTDIFLDYRQVAKIYLANEFNQGKFGSVNYIIPKIREIYDYRITDNEVTAKALQIVLPMQYLFIHEKSFIKNVKYDFNQIDNKEVKNLISLMIDNVIDN